jgi:hypothetical protein
MTLNFRLYSWYNTLLYECSGNLPKEGTPGPATILRTSPYLIFPSHVSPNLISRVTFPRDTFPRITFPRISFSRVTFPWISFPLVKFSRISFPRITFSQISFPRITIYSGKRDLGKWDSGKRDSGKWDSGKRDLGKWDSKRRNSGKWDSRKFNSGKWYLGKCDSGKWDLGKRDSGKWDSGKRVYEELCFRGFGPQGNDTIRFILTFQLGLPSAPPRFPLFWWAVDCGWRLLKKFKNHPIIASVVTLTCRDVREWNKIWPSSPIYFSELGTIFFIFLQRKIYNIML